MLAYFVISETAGCRKSGHVTILPELKDSAVKDFDDQKSTKLCSFIDGSNKG